eukprot:773060-Prymnesium_polylepis.2
MSATTASYTSSFLSASSAEQTPCKWPQEPPAQAVQGFSMLMANMRTMAGIHITKKTHNMRA